MEAESLDPVLLQPADLPGQPLCAVHAFPPPGHPRGATLLTPSSAPLGELSLQHPPRLSPLPGSLPDTPYRLRCFPSRFSLDLWASSPHPPPTMLKSALEAGTVSCSVALAQGLAGK